VREDAASRPGEGSSAARQTSAASRSDSARVGDVVVGIAASALRLGAGIGRVALLPGRVLARSSIVEPVVRAGTDGLASAGREAGARGRRRLEAAASDIIVAPETTRTLDRALAGPIPEALGDETIERLARRVIESPAFERILRDFAQSRVVTEVTDEAIRSPKFQRALEEILSGPMLRALGSETRTLGSEVAARVRESASRVDDALERAASRLLRRWRTPRIEPGYAGLASRGVAFAADAAITQLTVLTLGALVGLVGSFLGLSAPTRLVAPLAATGWLLFVGGYYLFFWTTAGQTPGMRPLGLRVTDADARPPGTGRSLLRLASSALAIASLGVGFLTVLVDGRRRALQDFLAGTVVVQQRDPRPTGSAPDLQ
jgi:uncharacterized RDD family membrane protein YckC